MNRWLDWLEQAKRDLKKAQLDLEYEYHEWACFTSQQAAEKALKALGLKIGLTLWGHSLTEMLSVISEKKSIPEEIQKKARLLDMYYIPPRYPNGFPAGKPGDYYTEDQAKEAISAARDIIRLCEGPLS